MTSRQKKRMVPVGKEEKKTSSTDDDLKIDIEVPVMTMIKNTLDDALKLPSVLIGLTSQFVDPCPFATKDGKLCPALPRGFKTDKDGKMYDCFTYCTEPAVLRSWVRLLAKELENTKLLVNGVSYPCEAIINAQNPKSVESYEEATLGTTDSLTYDWKYDPYAPFESSRWNLTIASKAKGAEEYDVKMSIASPDRIADGILHMIQLEAFPRIWISFLAKDRKFKKMNKLASAALVPGGPLIAAITTRTQLNIRVNHNMVYTNNIELPISLPNSIETTKTGGGGKTGYLFTVPSFSCSCH